MNTTYRSAGLIDGSKAAAILRRAVCVLGASDRRMVIGHDGSSIELVRVRANTFQVRVAANDDFGPVPPTPAIVRMHEGELRASEKAKLAAAEALIAELNGGK